MPVLGADQIPWKDESPLSYVKLRVEREEQRTQVIKGPKPIWNEEFQLCV